MNSDSNDSLLIIGCGWVGKKLGHKFSEAGFTVYGTTRSSANFAPFNELGIKPVKLELPVDSETRIRIPKANHVLISITPGSGENRDNYPVILEQLSKELAEQNAHVIMYSTTAAYGNATETVQESDAEPKEHSTNEILAAEGALLKHCPDALILRICGLYGEDRHPAKFMAGRKDIAFGDAPVNLVHRDDLIQITEKIINEDIRGDVFNVCSSCHPTRSETYTTIAERLELDKPTFREGGSERKTVSSKKLVDQLGIEFLHDDPLEFE